MPMGKPSWLKPAGTLMPGKPAKFNEVVKISLKYICTGSALWLTMAGAAVGAAGA